MLATQILAIAMMLAQGPASSPAAPSLDYSFFKERVQPIFLQKRPGHARCVTCHQHGSPPLQPLAPGASGWNEEQSRKNFAMWKQFVVPGNPLKSPLLIHPLAEAAGGDRFHAGGKHWSSQNDPAWQTVAAWVRGQTLGGSK
jgi:hypothetical protein